MSKRAERRRRAQIEAGRLALAQRPQPIADAASASPGLSGFALQTALATVGASKPLAAEQRSPFEPQKPLFPVPAEMAMDDAYGPGGYDWTTAGGYADFGFNAIRFQDLALLAQRPEHRRIVEVIATEMTRKGVDIHTTGDEGSKSDKINAIKQAFTDFGVVNLLKVVATDDGFFGRGHIYVDLGDVSDQELTTDIGDGMNAASRAKLGLGKLKGFRTVEPMWVYPRGYNGSNPLAADWYRPQAWLVQGKQVHTSRLLTFVGREVPDILKPAYMFGGVSLSQLAKPYVDNWLRTRQSVADLINAFSVMVLATPMNNLLATGGGDLIARMNTFINTRDNRGLMAIDKETEDLKNVSAPLGGLEALQAQAQEHMAAVSGIPLVKLLGITPTGLNACLPSDTLILTDRGQVQIKDVTLADKVMTRRGYAPLTFSGVTKYAEELIEIRTSSRTLRCTANHPIWLTSTNEFVPAENVRLGDHLLLIGEKVDTPKTPRPSHGEGNGGGVERMATTLHGAETQRGLSFSIAKFGKRIVHRSRMASTFITSIATSRTIGSQTLSQCMRRITWRIITSNIASPQLLAPSLSPASSVGRHSWSKNFRAGRNFAPANALSQTDERTAPRRQSRPLSALAKYAVSRLRLGGAMQNSALANAEPRAKTDPRTCANTIARTLKNSVGRYVLRAARQVAMFRANARDAKSNSFQSAEATNCTARNSVRTEHDSNDTGIVVAVRKVPASEWVYDLSVADGHLPEFYANGILTHNSSEGEIRVFYDWVHAFQESLFRPNLTRILRLIQIHLFGEVDPEITFRFEPLWSMSEKEKAEVDKLRADTGQVLIDSGTLAPIEERQRLADDPTSPYHGLDVDDLPDLSEEVEEGLEPEGRNAERSILGRAEAVEEEDDGPSADHVTGLFDRVRTARGRDAA